MKAKEDRDGDGFGDFETYSTLLEADRDRRQKRG
jgi:hypothetical protein